MKRALILGITGQDGTLLANRFKAQGIEYSGLASQGIVHADGRLIRPGKLSDATFIQEWIKSFSPTHVYYLAAHHHSAQDSELSSDPILWEVSLQVQVLGLIHVLEALRKDHRQAKLFYASSSHIFGSPSDGLQNEDTSVTPNNVYGLTKATGMEVCRYYQEQHALFISVGILYNHESIYRKEKFLSKKICRAVLDIKNGRATQLVVGNLSSEADWGYAPDYVEAMERILDLARPDQYIIATGERHTVREFVQLAFEQQNLDYQKWVKEDSSLIRSRPGSLIGDSRKLRRDTGWSPSVSFQEMVSSLMIETQRQESLLHE